MFFKKVLKMFVSSPLDPKLNAVAKRICEQCGWDVSNLRLQKLIYIAQMIHVGRYKEPLIEKDFQAWMYGPVIPSLYHKLKGYGSDPVGDRFYETTPLTAQEEDTINFVCDRLKGATGSRLVAITHRDGGAWFNNYQSGIYDKIIPLEDIEKEYEKFHG